MVSSSNLQPREPDMKLDHLTSVHRRGIAMEGGRWEY